MDSPCRTAAPRLYPPRTAWRRARGRSLALLLPVLLTGCADGDEPPDRADAPADTDRPSAATTPGLRATPEATSLLGEPLYALALDSASEAGLLERLDSAEAVYEARPDDPEALIWLGRRLGYLGRYREAIDAFSEGIEKHPGDARFYRHRGHRYITTRQLERAESDLEHAARLIAGQEDRVEPDGLPNAAGVPRSTLQTNIWYHLGLARYLQRDFQGSREAFRRGYDASPNDDMRVAMADWLWLTLRRLGNDDGAAALLEEISPDMEILENEAYLRRLLVYKGELDPGSLIPTVMPPPSDSAAGEGSAETAPLDLATYGYGLGTWYLVNGDRIRARETYLDVLGTGYWPAFGYIAAEAELAHGEEVTLPDSLAYDRSHAPPAADTGGSR
jgi:tetratricopeptide (TPR) repeat protein